MKSSAATKTAPPGSTSLTAAWGLLLFALALMPDQKILRWKLLCVELGASAVLAELLAEALLRSRAAWRRARLDVFVAAYALSGLVFWRLSPEPQNSELELTRMLLCGAAFVAASQGFPRVSRPRGVLGAWSAAAALVSLYALLQHSGGAGPLLVPLQERPPGTFGNPIFLAAYLAASLLVTAGLLIETELGAAQAWGLLACAGLQLAGLWLAQSRAAFAGLIAGGFLWALKRQSGRRRWMLFAGLALFAAGTLWQARDRQWTHGLIWRDALRLWLAHPWMGCGLGRFHIEFPAFASEALKAQWPQQRVIINFAHDEYLQVLCETGLAGFALFAAVPVVFLGWFLGAGPTRLAEGPALAALALFAGALFSPDLRFGVSAFAAFAAMGMAQGLSPGDERSVSKGCLLGAALLLAFFVRLAAAPVLAERTLERQTGFHIDATPEVQAVLTQAEERLATQPGNADLAEQLGYLYARERAWPAAISRYELAARLAPDRPGPLNNLGNIHYSLGEFDKAIDYWERSLAVKPDQLDAHLNLAKLYYERGRLKESARHVQAALRLDPANAKARILLKKMVE